MDVNKTNSQKTPPLPPTKVQELERGHTLPEPPQTNTVNSGSDAISSQIVAANQSQLGVIEVAQQPREGLTLIKGVTKKADGNFDVTLQVRLNGQDLDFSLSRITEIHNHSISSYIEFLVDKLTKLGNLMSNLLSDDLLNLPRTSGIISDAETNFCDRPLEKSKFLNQISEGVLNPGDIILGTTSLLNPKFFEGTKDKSRLKYSTDLHEKVANYLIEKGDDRTKEAILAELKTPKGKVDVGIIKEIFFEYVNNLIQDFRLAFKLLGVGCENHLATLTFDEGNIRPEPVKAEEAKWVESHLRDDGVPIEQQLLSINFQSVVGNDIRCWNEDFNLWTYQSVSFIRSNILKQMEDLSDAQIMDASYVQTLNICQNIFQNSTEKLIEIRTTFFTEAALNRGMFNDREIQEQAEFFNALMKVSVTSQKNAKQAIVSSLQAIQDKLELAFATQDFSEGKGLLGSTMELFSKNKAFNPEVAKSFFKGIIEEEITAQTEAVTNGGTKQLTNGAAEI